MRKPGRGLLVVAAFSVAVMLSAPFLGIERIVPGTLAGPGQEMLKDIFWKIRLPRVISAFVAGATLAMAGMAFQAYFRNPLATPFTLGVSSGAAFGAALAMRAGILFSFAGIGLRSISAFI